MQTVMQETWTGCYREGWQALIVPEAFAHPAKFARGLITRLYQHAREEGWLRPGMAVLDPFGGVSLGALHAALWGMQHVSVELEDKFHQLALANMALWQQRYGHLPQWVRPVVLQGDSRYLAQVIAEAGCVVTSPPYANGLGKEETYADQGKREKNSHRGIMREKGIADPYYGTHPAQLGNLPLGSVDACLSLPPYAEALRDQRESRGPGQTSCHDPRKQGARYTADGATSPAGYGMHPGQLGAMAPGQVEAVISSPPYEASVNSTSHGIDWEKAGAWRGNRQRGNGTQHEATLCAQLNYSASSNQLGNTHGATFWEAARQILEQLFQILRPGGHAIFVTKNYVRDKQEVPFTEDWARLCQAVGFEWLHHHHALLVEEHGTQEGLFGEVTVHQTERKSFFRRLAENKGSPRIDHESVLCFRKPYNGMPPDEAWHQLPLVDGVASSPPYAGAGEVLGAHNGIDWSKTTGTGKTLTPGRRIAPYGTTPGQLGAMPTGKAPVAEE